MRENRPKTILDVLRRTYAMQKCMISREAPFRTLIRTILSQNTSDRNTSRAFENLSSKFKITPEVLAKADTKQIEQCLKVAGLYRNKAMAIKNVSKIVDEKYDGDLRQFFSLTLEEARNEIMQLPSVGPKTADVLLLFSAGKPTIPVDTHVNRVSKRLGLVPADGGYECIREALQSEYDPSDYLEVHVLLISHGRKYCRAKTPLCKQCPISVLCPSRHLWDIDD